MISLEAMARGLKLVNFERDGLALPTGPSYLGYGSLALLMAVRQTALLVPDAPTGRQAGSFTGTRFPRYRQAVSDGRQARRNFTGNRRSRRQAGRHFPMAGRQAALLVPGALTGRQIVANDFSLHQT